MIQLRRASKFLRRVLLTATCGLAAVAAAAHPQGPDQRTRRAPETVLGVGKLLVASTSLGDPNFARTVVFLFSYSADGAAGLIVNRPTATPLGTVWPDVAFPRGPLSSVFEGGPVSTAELRALARPGHGGVDGIRILPDVMLLATPEDLKQSLSEAPTADRLRVYAGYAGWGAGQLVREVRLGAWHVFDGSSAAVFDAAPGTMWDRFIRMTQVMGV